MIVLVISKGGFFHNQPPKELILLYRSILKNAIHHSIHQSFSTLKRAIDPIMSEAGIPKETPALFVYLHIIHPIVVATIVRKK